MTTPNQMPKKASTIKAQVLGALIETRPTSWVRKTLVPATSISEEDVIKTKVEHQELRFPLAQNVSELSVERAARR